MIATREFSQKLYKQTLNTRVMQHCESINLDEYRQSGEGEDIPADCVAVGNPCKVVKKVK